LPLIDFRYRAVDEQNRLIRGQFSARSFAELERHLQQNHLLLFDYQIKPSKTLSPRSRCSPQQRIEFCFYLGQLLAAGIPLIDSLQQFAASLADSPFRRVVQQLAHALESGQCLSAAMQPFTPIFDPVLVQLVQIGEKSGQLPAVFKHLTDTLTWQQRISQNIKKALWYPAFLLSLIVLTLIFVLYWLVPQLLQFVQTMGLQLPWHTKLLITLSNFLQQQGWLVLLSLITFFSTVILAVRFSTWTRRLWDQLLFNTWGVGKILRQLMLARFSRFFALMYQSGLPILDILTTLRGTLGNHVMEQALKTAHEHIVAGDSISEGFAKTRLFSTMTLSMLAMGETTGQLDQALYHVSDFYQQQAQYQLEKFHALLEPALTVFLALLLGGLMLSVLQPIYNLINHIHL